jgi:WD40 repeat protein
MTYRTQFACLLLAAAALSCLATSSDARWAGDKNPAAIPSPRMGKGGTVKIWDAEKGQQVLLLKAHTNAVNSVAFSPDGKRLATAGLDQTVKVWDADTGKQLLSLKGHRNIVVAFAFSADGKRLASGSLDKTVKVWDAVTGQLLLTFEGHTYYVNSVAFSPDGKRLASASGGFDAKNKPLPGETKVWDAATGQELLSLKGHTGPVNGVAFSADGKRLATASGSINYGEVKVWDAATGQEVLDLKGHTSFVVGVAFSPDGKRLASGSYDKTVKVWDAATGQEVLTLKGHTGQVTSVAFSADSTRIASAGAAGTVKVWDTATGQLLLNIQAHASQASMAFSADAKHLATAGYDPTPDASWLGRHEDFVAIAKKGDVNVLFVGDSITDSWRKEAARPTWEKHFAPLKSANFGIAGDRTEHVLWRLQNGELDGIQPKVVVLMIGTNNTFINTAEQIAAGIKAIVKTIQEKSPGSKVLLLGVFPRGAKSDMPVRDEIAAINKSISALDDGGRTVKYLDIGEKFLHKDGSLTPDIMPDLQHLSKRGYEIWGDAIAETVQQLAGVDSRN